MTSIWGLCLWHTHYLFYIFCAACAAKWGTVGHEIGHALGLIHEHQRPDRNRNIIILENNIDPSLKSDLRLAPTSLTTTHDVPYDLGSIMHYEFNSNINPYAIGGSTILPIDPTQLSIIGQRTEISFYDAKAVNMAYCSDVCVVNMPMCLRNGYTDPNNCHQCRCPPPYGGRMCDDLSPQTPGCTPGQQYLFLTEKQPQVELSSPNYGNGRYIERMGCTWQVTTTVPSQITFWFEARPFGIFSLRPPSCAHWVEVWYLPTHGIHGERFCGNEAPSNKFVAVSATVTVVFSAPFSGFYLPLASPMFPFTGFRLYLKVDVEKEIEQKNRNSDGDKIAIGQGIKLRIELDASQSKASTTSILVPHVIVLIICLQQLELPNS